MLEYFIAKRYLRSKHKLNFITIISLLSTTGIAIGVAALIVVLSVFNGFGSLVTSILVSFDPHIRISVVDEKGFASLNSIETTLNGNKNINQYFPFVEGKAILLNRQTYEIINLKGIKNIREEDAGWGIASKIISGKMNLPGNSNNIVLGLPLALRLSARVGDTITVTSAYNIEKTIASFSLPQTRRFIVAGIFESNNRDYDVSYAFTNIADAQRLFGLKNQFNGYDILLNDFHISDKIKEDLTNKLNTSFFKVETWYDLHKELYDVMAIERWSAYILLCLIIAVATFNIFASLTMTVIEKKQDIGIFRSMGVNKKSVLRIFMFEGLLVGIIGTITGIILGIAVCYLQVKYNFYPLDPTKYIIDAMPIEIRFTDIIAIGAMAMLLSFLASLYPAKRAAKTIIIDAIKYE